MSDRTLAGRWDPRGGGLPAAALADAVSDGTEPATADRGEFALAWTADDPGRRRPSSVLCVVDGEVTGGGALAAELGVPPDTPIEAVLSVGWRRWGDELPERVRGEFVLVVWDADAERGLLARGGLGQRPLFVVNRGSSVLFASEVRNLLALLPQRPGPDRLAVAHWLARTALRDGRTLHEGITRLAPGSALHLGGRAAKLRRFWAPRYAPPITSSGHEAVMLLGAGMRAAVGRAVDGGGPVGVLLSGGFDSGSVAALAAQIAAPPRAYSAVFPAHPELDESARIGAVRDTLGLTGVEAPVRGGSPLRAALEFQTEWQSPCVSPNWFVWSPLVRQAGDDGVAMLLDGEGGDELFGCSAYLIADLLRRGRVRAAARVARAIPGMGPSPSPGWVRRALVQFGVRGGLPPRLHRALRRARGGGTPAPAWLAGDLRKLHRTDEDPWAWKRGRAPRWWAAKAHELTTGAEALGAADQLRREAASAGIRFAHPYRDRELVELALSLPPEPAFDARLDRPLAREAVRGLLPDVVRDSDRKPFFNGFLADALETDLSLIRRLVGAPDSAMRAFVDADALRAGLLDAPPGRRGTAWPMDVWRVATLECWLRAEADPRSASALLDSTESVLV